MIGSAKRVVTFAVDGASNLGVRGASARQVVDVSHIESNVFALIGKWLVLMTPLGEPCHVLQRKLGLALEAAGPTHVDYLAAVNRQQGLYNGARQWKELQKCVQRHVQDKRSGLQLIPTSHRIRWSQAHARRNTAFLANVPWVARHLDSKVQHSTKEEDVWEDCHDASLLAWGVVYGDILHGMRCFNSVAQLCAPTGAHLATATGMLEAQLQRVAREEGPGWLQFKVQTVTGAWRGVQLVQFDSGGQKCATTPPFPGVQARAVTDVLLAGIKEGQATIDPRGVLECAVLLDHGRFVALPVNERAASVCPLPSLKPSVLGADRSVHGQQGGVPLQRLVPLPIAVKGASWNAMPCTCSGHVSPQCHAYYCRTSHAKRWHALLQLQQGNMFAGDPAMLA